ncbi:hypothetical protein [Collimonas sp.]|jgi:hypothetical protein|uniref:hypothetical protein n=1 Tax=Collimonas sp. TaxID=1963772 RepID=UPI002CC64FFA|nr:hypothetical protein [Collimonas sp.]HWW05601.1 hypothetical protein [Collimonas sp.]
MAATIVLIDTKPKKNESGRSMAVLNQIVALDISTDDRVQAIEQARMHGKLFDALKRPGFIHIR